MSNTRAIAAVTTTLRNMLNTLMHNRDDQLSGLAVTTLPLDLARKGVSDLQLNIFLYQTAVNIGWRNRDMPGVVRPGETAAPPLALNLHYLITAYGVGETDADAISHRVLASAMSVLHDHAVLDRGDIALAIKDNDLADQFESLRITLQPMSLDDMSKLWTIFQIQYRISAAYEVTVVLIDSHIPVRSPLPVLARGADDRGPTAVAAAAPVLESIVLPHAQSAARLGEAVSLLGRQLSVDGTKVRFTSTRLAQSIELDPQAGADGALDLVIPATDPLALWAPGFYSVGLVVRHAGQPAIASNEIPFALAPQIAVTLKTFAAGTLTLTLTCAPRIADGQRVLLLLGERQVAADSITSPPDLTQPTELVFNVPAIADGDYVLRLRVDGADSIPVSYAGAVPAFDPLQRVTVP